jgi:cell division protein FtsN
MLDLQERSAAIEEPFDAAPEPIAEATEFEFVLGRRQIASLLFVATVVLMICVAISYLAGKSMSAKAPLPILLNQEPAPLPEAPLFADPKLGAVYIQMAAVERGVAVIFTEGLRKRGLTAFVAPGPNEKIFRVLIGPLPDPASYVKAKETVDKIGLATFARRFPN